MKKLLFLALFSLFINPANAVNVNISDLPAASSVTGTTNLFECEQAGTNNQCTSVQIAAYIYGLMSGDATFLQAVAESSQLGTAFVNFFNAANAVSKCYMPALYLWIGPSAGNFNWNFANPDSYATISGTPTEGAALTVNSQPWIAMGNRNQALPV